jgi:hypothetical protein
MMDDGSLTNLTNEIKWTFEEVRAHKCEILPIDHGIGHGEAMSAIMLSASGQCPVASTKRFL